MRHEWKRRIALHLVHNVLQVAVYLLLIHFLILAWFLLNPTDSIFVIFLEFPWGEAPVLPFSASIDQKEKVTKGIWLISTYFPLAHRCMSFLILISFLSAYPTEIGTHR